MKQMDLIPRSRLERDLLAAKREERRRQIAFFAHRKAVRKSRLMSAPEILDEMGGFLCRV